MDRRIIVAAALAASAIAVAPAFAATDQYLGSYVARISAADHQASDGYPLDTAAQMVRQDRANVHKFGVVDAEDDDDPWFGTAAARARLEKMLNQSSAMSSGTRSAIANGEPMVEVKVYRHSVRVRVIGY